MQPHFASSTRWHNDVVPIDVSYSKKKSWLLCYADWVWLKLGNPGIRGKIKILLLQIPYLCAISTTEWFINLSLDNSGNKRRRIESRFDNADMRFLNSKIKQLFRTVVRSRNLKLVSEEKKKAKILMDITSYHLAINFNLISRH